MSTLMQAMIELQDRMNTKVDPQWKQTGNPFLRAITVEGGEAMEHVGWKWWKKQVRDDEQFKIELVDIWHFILSEAIIQKEEAALEIMYEPHPIEFYVSYGIEGYSWHRNIYALNTLDRLEMLTGFAALRAPISTIIQVFKAILLMDTEWELVDLHRGYVGKNVLNFFRQDHGYKTGEYHKTWFGEEDNVWLERIMNGMSDVNEQTLYHKLSVKYHEVVVANTKAAVEETTAVDHDEEYARRLQGRGDDAADDSTYSLNP